MLRLKTRLKKTRQNKKIERGRDSIQSERALDVAHQHWPDRHAVLNSFGDGSYYRCDTDRLVA
jgi:hypothetical protein